MKSTTNNEIHKADSDFRFKLKIDSSRLYSLFRCTFKIKTANYSNVKVLLDDTVGMQVTIVFQI